MQKKTKGRKNYVLEAEEVAVLAGASKSLVVKVRTSEVSGVTTTGKKAQRILAIDELAEASKTILIKEIERIVKL